MPGSLLALLKSLDIRCREVAAYRVGHHAQVFRYPADSLALRDALVNPLMARIEAAHMPAHGDDAGVLGDLDQLLGVLDGKV